MTRISALLTIATLTLGAAAPAQAMNIDMTLPDLSFPAPSTDDSVTQTKCFLCPVDIPSGQ